MTVAIDGNAETVAAALISLPTIREAAVAIGSGTNPTWEVQLIDADLVDGEFVELTVSVAKELGRTKFAVASAERNSVQSIAIPDGGAATIRYGQAFASVTAGGDLVAALNTFKPLQSHTVSVTGDGTQSSPWVVALTPAEEVDEELGEEFPTYDLFQFQVHETVANSVRTTSVASVGRSVLIDAAAGNRTALYGSLGRDTAYANASDLETALEALPTVRDVVVRDSGTNYEVFVVDADRDELGNFLPIQTQQFNNAGTPIQQGAPNAITRLTRTATAPTQHLVLDQWQDHATFSYAGQSVDLTGEMTVAEIKEALESLSTINEVRVSGGGDLNAWYLTLLDANVQPNGGEYVFQREVRVQHMSREMQAEQIEDWSLQWIDPADVRQRTSLFYDGNVVVLGASDVALSTSTQAGLLQDALRTISGLENASVVFDTTKSAYQVDLTNVPDLPQRLTIDTDGGVELASVASWQTQWIESTDVVDTTVLHYRNESITLTTADIDADTTTQATQLQARLREFTGLELVTVDFDAEAVAYRITFANPALRLYVDSGTGPVAATVEEAENELDVQWIDELAIVEEGVIDYAGQFITLTANDISTNESTQASLLQARLREFADLPSVLVSYDAAANAYQVTINETASGAPPERLSSNFGVSESLTAYQTIASHQLPPGLTQVTLSADGVASLALDLTGDAASIESQLSGFGIGSDFEVEGDGGVEDPFELTIFDYDETRPVTVTYDDGYFAALELQQGSGYVTAEIADENEVFEVPRTPDGNVAVFAISAGLPANGFFISPFQTFELERPRMIEKPVWADLNGDGSVELTGETDWFEDPEWVNDHRVDTVSIAGSGADDYFLVGHEILQIGVDANNDPIFEKQNETIQIKQQEFDNAGTLLPQTLVVTIRGIDIEGEALPTAPETRTYDQITVDGGAGDDQLIAGFIPNSTEILDTQIVTALATSHLELKGGTGNDRLVGTPFADTLNSGTGSDTVTGGEGVDSFFDDSPIGDTDRLIEQRDLNFSLSDEQLAITGTKLSDDIPPIIESVNETETSDGNNIHVFEEFELFGGSKPNAFAINEFTKSAFLDGTESSDLYVVTLSGAFDGESNVHVVDSGTGSNDADAIEIRGSSQADALHLDADSSRQEIRHLDPSQPFRISYGNDESGIPISTTIPANATTEQLETILESLSSVSDIEVTGSGTEEDPWKLVLHTAERNSEDRFLRFNISESDLNIAEAKVSRATVTRLPLDLIDSLLASKPNLDAMFERPAFETQLFSVVDGAVANGVSDSYTLSYLGETTTTLTSSSDRVAIKNALQELPGITEVDVTGVGTLREPFTIKILDGVTDSRGNFSPLIADNLELVNAPMDINDAAATVRPSVSLTKPTEFQRVFYDFTVENVAIHGGAGSDNFISDDSMAAIRVHGDGGNDNFLIGRVLKTKRVFIDHDEDERLYNSAGEDIGPNPEATPRVYVDVVDGLDGVSNGTTFNAFFYGGSGDDYFEVNHNVGELELYGESGDDTFFLKAILQETGKEREGGEIPGGCGR